MPATAPGCKAAADCPSPSRPPKQTAALACCVGELIALQAEYAAWFDLRPESLQSSATAQALRAIADLDRDELAVIEPPRGYGPD